MYENRRKCFKCGRSPAEHNVKLFRFPKPGVRNLIRCLLWAKYIYPEGQYSSLQCQTKLYNDHKMLCEKHFKDADFTDVTKAHLLQTAVPCEQDTHSLPDLGEGDDQEAKYMQVLDTGKGLVQLDLLNLTLVRCQDGEESYQLVANAGTSDGEMSSDATVTCVLQSSDNEDPDNQDSYVMVENENGQNSLVILKSALQQATTVQKKVEVKKSLSPTEILEKAKSLQKAKALLSSSSRGRGRGRKRKSDLPPPHELLASPNFKLYLYNCKLCSFKCNAVKEMSAHKAREHGAGAGRGARRGAAVTLQCARCPFRAATHTQLMKHVQEKHLDGAASSKSDYTVHLDTEEVEAADVLVCGACGFESGSRSVFRKHIEEEHGATTC